DRLLVPGSPERDPGLARLGRWFAPYLYAGDQNRWRDHRQLLGGVPERNQVLVGATSTDCAGSDIAEPAGDRHGFATGLPVRSDEREAERIGVALRIGTIGEADARGPADILPGHGWRTVRCARPDDVAARHLP